MATIDPLTFDQLRAANVARLPRFKNRRGGPAHSQSDGSDWALSTWSNAVLGELGELANIIKKFERGDYPSFAEAQADMAPELADVATYLDLLAFRCGVNLAVAVAEKFNTVSERVGCDDIKLPVQCRHPNLQARVLGGPKSSAAEWFCPEPGCGAVLECR